MESPTATARQNTSEQPRRLIIRVKLVPPELARRSRWRRMFTGPWPWIAGALAAALIATGILLSRPEPAPAALTSTPARPPQPRTVEPATPTATPPVEIVAPLPPDPAPSPVSEVIPDVPQSALDTIRGTVRVSVLVTIDPSGTVLEATAEDPGPSRYFERLSLQAARKWAFTPATSTPQRRMLLKFNFTRTGVTASAAAPQQ